MENFDIYSVKASDLDLVVIDRGEKDFVLYYEKGYDSDKEVNLGFEVQYDNEAFNGVVSYSTNVGEDDEEWNRLNEGELFNHVLKLAETDYLIQVRKLDIQNNVKEWYMKVFHTDELGSEIGEQVIFYNVYNALKVGLDIYDLLQVGDSIIRERVFSELADILNVDYDYIYNLWLKI